MNRPRQFVFAALTLLAILQSLLSAAAQQSEEETAIIKLVQESQKAGREKGDAAKWLAPWAKDAKLIGGRTEKVGMYDLVLTWPQIKASAELRYCGPSPKDVSMTFENVQVQINGNQAVLRYRSVLKSPKSLGKADEIFLLRKTKTGWEIYENRYWPVSFVLNEEETTYDAKTWQEFDAQAEKFRQKKDLFALTTTLIVGYRDAEAHVVTKQLTQARPQDPDAWVLRGDAAVLVGDIKDALDSYQQALTLDPDVDLPDYVRIALKKKS